MCHRGTVSRHRSPKRGQTLPPLATRLRQLRRAHGGSQAEVAEAIGISRSYLAGIEAGSEWPGRETLAAFAVFYGISVDQLYAALPAPGLPKAGEFINRPNELALLHFWRRLARRGDRQTFLAEVLKGLGAPPEILDDDDAA